MKKFKEKQQGKAKQFWMLLILLLISFSSALCAIVQQKTNVLFSETNISTQRDTILSYNVYSNSKDERCESWRSTKTLNILGFIKDFKELSVQEWHQCFGHFPCGIRGELIYGNERLRYNLNSGGWLYLKGKNYEKYLGSINKKDTLETFISVYYCDEEWGN